MEVWLERMLEVLSGKCFSVSSISISLTPAMSPELVAHLVLPGPMEELI